MEIPKKILNASFAPCEHAWVCPTPAVVLAVSGHHAGVLCDSDTGGEDLVHSQVWRMMVVAGRIHSLRQEITTGYSRKEII
jgi:hypothetical protein